MNNIISLLIYISILSIVTCIEERYLKTIYSLFGKFQNDFKHTYNLTIQDNINKSSLQFEHFRLFRPKLLENKIKNSTDSYLTISNISFAFAVNIKFFIFEYSFNSSKREFTYNDFLFEIKYGDINFLNKDSLVLYLKNFSDFSLYYSKKTHLAKLSYFNFFTQNLTAIDLLKASFHNIISKQIEYELSRGNVIETDMKIILKQMETYFSSLNVNYTIGDEIVENISIEVHSYFANSRKFIEKNNTLLINDMIAKFKIVSKEPEGLHVINFCFPTWEFSHNYTNLHFELIKYDFVLSNETMKYVIENIYFNKILELQKEYFEKWLNKE